MNDGIEKKILERMGEALVCRKSELVNHLKQKSISEKSIDTVTKLMAQKGYLRIIYASETTFAITQKGMKGLK